jgi:hypothetical protein
MCIESTSSIPVAAMAVEATTILQLVLLLTWNCLFNTPTKMKNPLFNLFFTSYEAFKEVASSATLAFVDGLLNAL